MKPTTEKQRERMKQWYKENKEYHIANVQARQKANNYSSEKTGSQRHVRYIKRRTRMLYPIVKKYFFFKTREKCKFCPMFATEHHHYTSPPEIHKFNFVCHKCHMEKDLEMENHSKLNIQITKCAGKTDK